MQKGEDMMIREVDIKILQILSKYRIMTARAICILLGYKSERTIRYRLQRLVEMGLVYDERDGYKKVYFATQRGLREIGDDSRAYSVKGYETYHTLMIAETAAYLYTQNDIASDDFQTEREVKLKDAHYPDLIYGQIAVEVELNSKDNERLFANIKSNAKNFERQIWFLPPRLQTVYKRINDYAEKNGIDVEIIYLENMLDELKKYDMSNNSLREGRRYEDYVQPEEISIATDLIANLK